jgi:beta-1,4-mannooligosaccharide/beta-1,4-mannosyl-N-acetylglucosamine phosphorylase
MPNIPWEERPSGCAEVVWRYHDNPIIPRDQIPSTNSIYNSAVVPYQDVFAGVFRCDNKKREMNLNRGFSLNGISDCLAFARRGEVLDFIRSTSEI